MVDDPGHRQPETAQAIMRATKAEDCASLCFARAFMSNSSLVSAEAPIEGLQLREDHRRGRYLLGARATDDSDARVMFPTWIAREPLPLRRQTEIAASTVLGIQPRRTSRSRSRSCTCRVTAAA